MVKVELRELIGGSATYDMEIDGVFSDIISEFCAGLCEAVKNEFANADDVIDIEVDMGIVSCSLAYCTNEVQKIYAEAIKADIRKNAKGDK